VKMTIRQVDWILYNRGWLRAAVDAIGDGSRSLILLGPGGGTPDPTQTAAVRRADLTTVLDAVDRALEELPRSTRRIARLKYDEKLTYPEIAKRTHFSVRTIERRVRAARATVMRFLAVVEGRRLAAFWRGIGGILAG